MAQPMADEQGLSPHYFTKNCLPMGQAVSLIDPAGGLTQSFGRAVFSKKMGFILPTLYGSILLVGDTHNGKRTP
jgi:hypothetical protein